MECFTITNTRANARMMPQSTVQDEETGLGQKRTAILHVKVSKRTAAKRLESCLASGCFPKPILIYSVRQYCGSWLSLKQGRVKTV